MPFLTKPEEKIPIRKSLRAKGSPEGRAAGSDDPARTGGFDRLNLKWFFRKKRKKGISLFSGEARLCSHENRTSNSGRFRNADCILEENRFLHGGKIRKREGKSLNAGMTVEASIVLPLFLFFIFEPNRAPARCLSNFCIIIEGCPSPGQSFFVLFPCFHLTAPLCVRIVVSEAE